MSIPAARNWHSLMDMEEINLESRYTTAICNLAAMQAMEHISDLEDKGEDTSGIPVPDTSDPAEILLSIRNGNRPGWWPKRLDRLGILITFRPDGSTPEKIGPHPFDPNSNDGGIGNFMSLAKSLCDAAGTPFSGNLRIRIIRFRSKDIIGGYRGDVYVGDKMPKGKGGRGDKAEDDRRDEEIEYQRGQLEKKDELMQRMFANSANVIHASASAVNSMRGVNVAPPWMTGGENGEMPMWMMLAKGAMDMVVAAGLGQSPSNAGMKSMQQMMQQPVPQGAPRQIGASNPAGYLTDHQQQPSQDNLGYSDYQEPEEEGDFDGYYASDEDMLDDDWGNGEAWDDEGSWDNEEEEEEEEEEEGYSSPRGGSHESSDDIDDLFGRVNKYIDRHPEDRDKIKRLGLGLLPKLT